MECRLEGSRVGLNVVKNLRGNEAEARILDEANPKSWKKLSETETTKTHEAIKDKCLPQICWKKGAGPKDCNVTCSSSRSLISGDFGSAADMCASQAE